MAEQKPPGIFMPPGLAPKPAGAPVRPGSPMPMPMPMPMPAAPPATAPPAFVPPSFVPPGAPPSFAPPGAPPAFAPPGAPPAFAPPGVPPAFAPPAGYPATVAPISTLPPASMPAPQTASTVTRPTGRVIVFSGPKEGVGKSTIALNLALAWAGTQSRNVILVHLDPLCRSELSFMLNLQPPTLASLTQTVGKDITVLSKLLKGRVPISQWGVGVLPLGNNRNDAASLSPAQIVPRSEERRVGKECRL